MPYLLVVSLVWAFSFGLMKGRMGGLDSSLVAFVRVTLALIVFAPVFRPRGLRARDALVLLAIGAVQFGVMYVTYTAAYGYLQAYEVALWTIFTPLFVCMFEDIAAKKLNAWPYAAAVLAVVGAEIVKPVAGDNWRGIALIQVSNACFALGQIAYRRWRHTRSDADDLRVFGLLYAGAVLVTLPAAMHALPAIGTLTSSQWITLAYLGAIASGVCFFLWNLGATRVAAGTLAVMNNAKIPLAVAVSLLFFGEKAETWRLLAGGALVVGAGALAEWTRRRQPQ